MKTNGHSKEMGILLKSGYNNFKIYILLFLPIFFLLASPAAGTTWPAPGDWPIWGSQAAEITPVPWPADGDWVSYTALGSPLADPSVADPSNGGTSPQNYVSVTSNCPDKTLPSVYWAFDSVNNVIFFRFRLAAIPCTYATGPNSGSAATSDPWRSAQWSVLFDIDGDGYREFAVQLDGSTGEPSNPTDRLSIIYSATQDNSLDYTASGSEIYLVNQFPTGFVNSAGGTILNFHNSNSPDATWPNGSSETVWDYGMTRCVNNTVGGCTEYITDYQIPLSQLNATAVGGPQLTSNSSMSFLFATANSLQNPFQKDVVTTGDEVYIGDPALPGPFGDIVVPAGGSVVQPHVTSVTASGCGLTTLTAVVADAVQIVGGTVVTSITDVEFFYYADTNSNGSDDDGNTWTSIGSGSTSGSPIGTWTLSWDSTTLAQGLYLISVKATDAQGNITWAWVSPADISLIGPTPPNYPNHDVTGTIFEVFSNTCGSPPPYAVKTSNAVGPLSPGDPVIFTVTVFNTSGSAIDVSSVNDTLPGGFSYQSTGAGTLGAPSSSPSPGDTGSIAWTFPPASVPAGTNRTLIFTCTAPTVQGTYGNAATVTTSVGDLPTEPVEVSVGSPQLTVTKTAVPSSVTPGDSITYSINYANTSPVNVTGVTISDVLADGLTYSTNTGGGVYTAGTRTIDWAIGNLASGESGTVTITATVDDPFPSSASIPLENTVTLTSTESGPTTASYSVQVDSPRPVLTVQKSTTPSTVATNSNVTFTIDYSNTGNATATSLTLTDTVPAGLTFVSATGGGTESGGIVTWNLPDMAANTTGSVTVTFYIPGGYAGDNPLTNTVSLSAGGVSPVTDSFLLGVQQTTDICSTYYFSSNTSDVGFDGSQLVATTTVPSGAGTNFEFITQPDQSFSEALRFYTDPATANAVTFSGNLTTTFFLDRVNGGGITIETNVYDYNSTTGGTVLLGTNTQTFLGSAKGELSPFTVSLSGELQKGHRLLWVYNVRSNTNGSDTIYLQYGGTVTNPISGGTVNADSNANYCVSPPANLLIDKQVDNLTASPGNTLSYSILFSNTGQSNATGTQVVDTLPLGVTYVSATLNGGAVVPASISGQDYTFNVNSSDTGVVGQVTGGQAGELIITVTIDNPLGAGINSLDNSASLVSTQTLEVSDTATTTVLRPDVNVVQSADRSLAGPGGTVTYTFTIINSGTGPATNVTLNDVLPVQAYYTYVSGSTTLNGAPVADNVSGGTLNYNIGSLAAGETAVVTIQMVAGSAGTFPLVQTNLDSTATISDSETSGSRTSNTVTVTINPLPNLAISKTFDPSGPFTAGDTITCRITVSNDGGADALGVIVTDSVPAFTNYKTGSLEYEGSGQTDVQGDDTGHYDGVDNRAVFQIGTLTAGTTVIMSFQIDVQSPAPVGTTVLSNTARVTALNTAAKTDTITDVIEASPTMMVIKSGPESSPYPAAAATATSSGTSVQVDDVSPFVVNQYIRVAGQNRKITAVSGSTLTVDSAINVTNGDDVTGSIKYSLIYANTGSADAFDATLVDTLPAGAIYVESTSGGIYASGPGTVTWNIGALAVGDSGLVQVTIFPAAAGNLTNSAALSATGSVTANDNSTTGVGGLRITKSTTTPSISAGNSATYVIEITNYSPSTAEDVIVTDSLPSGFTYQSTGSISGGTRTAVSDPSAGDQAPVWGTFNISSGSTLTITFNALTASGIVGTFDNELSATSTNTSVGIFDPLLTTAEDVTVTNSGSSVVSGSLASAGDISVGCTATLNWTAVNATGGTLDPGGISVPVGNGSGSISVTPTTTTVYTLTLTGTGGPVTYNATVNVNPAPTISSFTATPSTIGPGDAVTFAATFTGGTGVITPGNYSITSGGTYILATGPSTDTTYTLTVTAPCGSASQDTAQTTVTVSGGSGPSGSLTSTGNISVGCSVILNWTATNADTGTLNPGNISIPVGDGSGSVTVTPTATTTYTLTLTGPGGTTNVQATVTVDPAPVITVFTATPSAIAVGQSVTFAATFTGGTGVITPGNYPIVSGGTYVLSPGPTTDTVYTLTVTAPCGSASLATAQTTVTVGGGPGGSLTASGDISVGCSAILNWTATNADSGVLTPGDIPVPVENGSGSITVTPTTTTTYTLTLTGPGGTTAIQTTVTVNPAPAITSFTATPSTIAAGEPVTFAATFTGGTGVITPGNFPITSGGTYVLTPGPQADTVYMLTVTAPCGADSQATDEAAVTVGDAPSGSLVSTGDISVGCSATLNWTAANADSGILTPGDIPVPVEEGSGSITVSPLVTTTYILTLTGPGGTTTIEVTVTVNPAPEITSFTVTPASIVAGEPIVFSAVFTGGTGVITPGNYSINSGETYTLVNGPSVDTVYTLTVTAPCGTGSRDSAAVQVEVISNSLQALKSVQDVNGGNLMPGDVILYTITLISDNNVDLTGVECVDPIPAHTRYVDGSVTGPAGSVIAITTAAIQYSNITVPARGQVSLTFKVKVDDPLASGVTRISNQAIVSYDSDGDGINDTDIPTDGDTVIGGQQSTDMPLTTGPNFNDTYKTGSLAVDADQNGVVSPGDTLRYQCVIINSGDMDAYGVTFEDVIPEYTDYVDGSVTATSGTATYESETVRINWIGDVAAGASVTIVFDVTVQEGIAQYSIISNQGAVDYDSDNDGVNDTRILTDSDLSLPGRQPLEFITGGISFLPAVKTAVAVNSLMPSPGDVLRYEIIITNPTAYGLSGIELVDSIPANTTFVPGSLVVPPGAAVVSETPTLRITNISIDPFSSVSIIFSVTIASDLGSGVDEIMNQAVIHYDTDGDGTNDSTTLTDWSDGLPGNQPTVTTITCPVMEISDISLKEIVRCGENIDYLITYINNSPSAAQDVVIRSNYDPHVAFYSSSPAPDPGTDDTWTIGRVEPGQTGTIRLQVKPVYRMPYLYVVPHSVTLTTNCDTRQAGTRTNVLGCGPR